MTRDELSHAVALAQSDEPLGTFVGEGSSQHLIDTFNCFGFDNYQPVHVTIRDVAALIRHECQEMAGEMDSGMLDYIARKGRNKFMIVGLGDESLSDIPLPHWYAAMM